MKPKVIIPTGLGINSHEELKYCFEIAGAEVDFIHWNKLIADPSTIDRYQGAGLAGGFAMGDQLGAGQSLANRIRESGFREKIQHKLNDPDFPMYIVCNSLQLLAKLDLFPIQVGTVRNDSGKHETGFWDVAVNKECDIAWFKYLKDYQWPVSAPISHGEGRIYVPDEHLETAIRENLIALTYIPGEMCKFFSSSRGDRYNPNGSVADIAGFGWSNNLVLFPHFERLHHNFQKPDREAVKAQNGDLNSYNMPTYILFKAAVDFMKKQQKDKE